MSDVQQQLYEARMFATEHNVKVDTAYCSPEFYMELCRQVESYMLGWTVPADDLPSYPVIQGLRIISCNLHDRFWLEGNRPDMQGVLYAVVPDAASTWRVDYAEAWQQFK